MNPVWIITGRGVHDSLRNRWVLTAIMLLAMLALSLGLLDSTPAGSVKVDPLTIAVVSLSSLSTFLVSLIAMLLSYDALAGEIECGTMALLLNYPMSRVQILAGKLISHIIIPILATAAGYGLAGIVLQLASGGTDIAAWRPFALLITASAVLDAMLLVTGYIIGARVKERGTAAGVAIGVQLFSVVVFDMILLGVLMTDNEQTITASVVEGILLFNPADIYRPLSLLDYENTAMYAGMVGSSEQISLIVPVLLAAQILWVFVPLVLAAWVFGGRQIWRKPYRHFLPYYCW